MLAALVWLTIFQQARRVSFAGGEGIVKSFKSENGTWTNMVKMKLGWMPALGRIGAETMVLFDEADLRAA